MAQSIYEKVFDSTSGSTSALPSVICTESRRSLDCVKSMAKALDKVAWISKALGAGSIHDFTTYLLPKICEAVEDADGLSTTDIISALPTIIRSYKTLDMQLLDMLLPSIHPVFRLCNENLARVADAALDLVASSGITIAGGISFLCTSVAENTCMSMLGNGIDDIDFLSSQLGKGTLQRVVDDILPDACAIWNDVTSSGSLASISISNVVEKLPDVLLWVRSLSRAASASPIIAPYFPTWPEKACSTDIVERLTRSLQEVYSGGGISLAPICKLNATETSCLSAIAASLGANEHTSRLFAEVVGANASSPETIVNTLVDVVLPSICGPDDITGNVDMVHLLRTLPSIVGVYNALDVPALAAYVGTEMHAFLKARVPRI